MFKNTQQTLFTFSSANHGVQNRQQAQTDNTCRMRMNPGMKPVTVSSTQQRAGGLQRPSQVQMSMGASSGSSMGVPQQKSFGFRPALRNGDFKQVNNWDNNQYADIRNAPGMSANSNSLNMQMSAAGSNNSFGIKASNSSFMSGYGMPARASRPAARGGAGPVMSTAFNVSGAKSNHVIDNYQDMSMSSARKPKSRAGWGSFARPRASALRATTIMMAGDVPEGSWADVKRQPVVGGNWKSNGDIDFVNSFPKNTLNTSDFDHTKMQVCVAPTDIHLASVNAQVKDGVNVMAQDVSQYPKGAYTGNVTADQLKDIGVNWTLTGHSERRTLCKESDKDVALKTKAAIEEGVTVMACIGEQLEERESGKTDEVNARQLQAIADEITEDQWKHVVIAYEPVWAIGTGKVATPEQAEETQLHIRKWLADKVSADVAGNTRILYGGSVNAGNCAELIKKPNIDGFLVGGASLKDDFKTIIETVNASVA